jgi:ankyrin repeat protein
MSLPRELWTVIMEAMEDSRALYLCSRAMLRAAPRDERRYWASHQNIAYFLPKMPTRGISIEEFARHGNLPMVKHLIGQATLSNRIYSLRQASAHRHIEIVKYLCVSSADAVSDGCAIVDAAIGGSLEIVKYLHNCGVSASVMDDGAMVFACMYGYYDIMVFLHLHGADLHARGGESLIVASRRGQLAIIKYICEHGTVDAHILREAFDQAAAYGHRAVMRYLADKF